MDIWPSLIPWVAAGFMIAVSVGIVVFVFQKQIRTLDRIREIAPRLNLYMAGPAADPEALPGPKWVRGLVLSLSPWRLEGTRGDLSVAIYQEVRGGGKSKSTWTIVEAKLKTARESPFQVGREHALLGLGKLLFRMQDIEVGVADFDRLVRLKGEDPQSVKRLFSNPTLREAVLNALESSPDMVLTHEGARWEKRVNLVDEQAWRETLDRVVALAEALDRGQTN